MIFLIISHLIFTITLGFYLITTLQWFSYKFERIIFHFTKPLWHLIYLILPIIFYYFIGAIYGYMGTFFVAFIYAAMILNWHFRLDKRLVFTPRVKRFFCILVVLSLVFDALAGLVFEAKFLGVFIPLIIAFGISFYYEKLQFLNYKKSAINRLKAMENLTIIEITASFGKTSIKNFLYQILSSEFRVYKTPRSVNTIAGLIKDINDELPNDTQIYIAEAGARLAGDIAQITELLNPNIVVVGEIGAQHIEYFKSIENIRSTKLEALNSKNLKMAFLHSSTLRENAENIEIYDTLISDTNADLDGVKFIMRSPKFCEQTMGEPQTGAMEVANDNKTLKFTKDDENSGDNEAVNGLKNSEIYTQMAKNSEAINFVKDGENTALMTQSVKQSEFFAPILGEFNAQNIAAAICVARYLGMSEESIKRAVARIESVEHRLKKMEAGGKIIIDDGFNGNLAGMLSSYDLVSKFSGRKVIVTPGIIESTREDNEKLGAKINKIFDLVMITGELNSKVLSGVIDSDKLILIKDKSNLTEHLAKRTKAGDLILFSNDAPSFI